METFDPRKTQQIWQRVYDTGAHAPDLCALIPLISQEEADGACCTRLSKRLGGRGNTLLKLAMQYRNNASVLRGICSILSEGSPEVAFPPPREESPLIALKKCYVNSLGRIRQYETLSENRDYGQVFHALAANTREQCVTLLELIGKLTQ